MSHPKTVTTPYIHINRGTNRQFVVSGIHKGCRKPFIVSKHRNYQAAAERAARTFTVGNFKRLWVNMAADYYDPVTLMTVGKA